MTCPIRNRSRLLVGCGSSAMALALALGLPQRAEAQGINATGEVLVPSSASINNEAPGQTTVTVFEPTAVIDWTPTEDVNGDALDFLPTGNTALFQAGVSVSDFAVLNRILPSANNNIVVIDGSVLSRIFDGSGNAVAGGFVAFYSPTGILIGSNASFDVGSLLLTTLDPDPTSFQNFATNNGTLQLAGATGSTARIQIDAGAQITASPENAFFAVVAADVQMSGTALVNGSHAYVAGEVVNLRVSNGLFDIEIPIGTAATGTVMDINGTVGGASSTGAGDNHMIYGVAAAQNDPISMLFSGNLGFEPAQQAGVVNGEIILSANYNVFGRDVQGDTISNGINAVFGQTPSPFGPLLGEANILMQDFASTSSILAIGTDTVGVTAVNSASSVEGNLLMVGRRNAELTAANGQSFDISGDVLVSSRAFGVVDMGLQDPSLINAQGGTAFIDAFGGGTMTIDGNALVTAEAIGGALDFDTAGTATGGTAQAGSTDGTLSILGNLEVNANARVTNQVSFLSNGATMTGGLAQVFAAQGGAVTLGGDVDILAIAFGRDALTSSDAFGGEARMSIVGGGTIGVVGSVDIFADAFGGSSSQSGIGSLADAGDAGIDIDGAGAITIDGGVLIGASGFGGTNFGDSSQQGTGGTALGGAARVLVTGDGSLIIGTDFSASANAVGGNGPDAGGEASAGIAGANVLTGLIDIGGNVFANADAEGGDGDDGLGGNGGNAFGGNAFLQADGGPSSPATINAAAAFISATGLGGRGGDGDSSDFQAGDGGNGTGGSFATPNQADPTFNSGAFLLAGGDNGNLNITAEAFVDATGRGGRGGDGVPSQFSIRRGGNGGIGTGGLAQAGLALLGGSGAIGDGVASFGGLFVESDGFGGGGGNGGQTGDPIGSGGNGFGGDAALTVSAGEVIADFANVAASGFGADGEVGADGQGGNAGIQGNGVLTMGSLNVGAQGFGGFGRSGPGGSGIGGQSFVALDGITATFSDDVFINAEGAGGFSQTGDGGDGTGGTAYIGVTESTPGSGTFEGNASVTAHGLGGVAGTGATGGTGSGGLAFVEAQAGSTVRFGTLQVTASGTRGDTEGQPPPQSGSDGIGGTAELRSSGTGSQIIVERNFSETFLDELNGGGIVAALGLGTIATGGTGAGGRGIGGTILVQASSGGSIALPQDPVNDPDSIGPNRLLAYGIGGGSNVDGGQSGDGFGGTGTIEMEGGTIIMGRTSFSVYGQGGSSQNATRTIGGGDGFGGLRFVQVFDGGTLTAELAEGRAGGFGGNGSGDGEGGSAFTGLSSIDLFDGTFNIVGNLLWADTSTGGSGATGGSVFASSGEGGEVQFFADNSTIDFAANSAGESGFVGLIDLRAGNGITQGGDVTDGAILIGIFNSTVTSGNFLAQALSTGGNVTGPTGRGGNVEAARVSASFSGSDVELFGRNIFASEARGGSSAPGSGIAGGAIGNEAELVDLRIADSDVTISPDANSDGALVLSARAYGGAGDQIGNATSLRSVFGVDRSTLILDELLVESLSFTNAITTGQQGGVAQSGAAEITIDGDQFGSFPPFSDISAGTISLATDAVTSDGGTATAGEARFAIAADRDAIVTADSVILTADASGANQNANGNTAGRFVVEIGGGSLNTANLSASASGDTLISSVAPSLLVAEGGDINVTGILDAFVLGDIQVRTSQGNIIGSAVAPASTTIIGLRARGRIEILGDNDAAIGLGGDDITLTAREIDIDDGARVGARSALFASLERDHTAIIGGINEEIGFTLTAAEIGRISANDFAVVGSNVITSDPDQPDVLVRDFTISGSIADGFSRFRIFPVEEGPGIIRVEGTVSYLNTATTDEFVINAGGRIEVVTPGGIRVTDTDGLPGGILTLSADSIWAADADMIGQLQSAPVFAGRDALLAVAVAGSDDPLGYLRARRISLGAGSFLLIRNTGTSTEQGGLLVGAGGLSIAADSDINFGDPLDVFAYGRRLRDDGTFVTGNDFFSEVNFNRTGQAPTTYGDASAFNDCIINTGVCPAPPPPPPEREQILPPLNNPTVIVDPVTFGEPTGDTVAAQNDKFGMDFPEQPESPLISEEPLLDDPVASGSDASLYSPSGYAPGEEN
ncbi:hypothetical protein [Erythrobacter sp.]|uniref:beta strand repeat-containing protein n=1 Tax=Erythrobacter sp. TaxID=1042 RepID=UPI0025EA09C6|nr:hypothetical protein [Erythrobacter sp.]